jgi:hypothetical protein
MGIQFKEILSQRDKDKRADQYTKWLEENGYEPTRTALLHVHSLTQELIKDLQRLKHDTQAASQLATNIEDIIHARSKQPTT